MAVRDPVRHGERWRGARRHGVSRGEFFSLGGLFVPYVKTRTPFAPWTLSEKIDKGDRWTVSELAAQAAKLEPKK